MNVLLIGINKIIFLINKMDSQRIEYFLRIFKDSQHISYPTTNLEIINIINFY